MRGISAILGNAPFSHAKRSFCTTRHILWRTVRAILSTLPKDPICVCKIVGLLARWGMRGAEMGPKPHFLQFGEAKMPKNGHFGPILGHCGPKNDPKCCVFGTFWQNGPQTRVLGHFGAKICVSLRGFAHFLHFLRYLQGLGPFFAKKRIFPWALGRGVAKTP